MKDLDSFQENQIENAKQKHRESCKRFRVVLSIILIAKRKLIIRTENSLGNINIILLMHACGAGD